VLPGNQQSDNPVAGTWHSLSVSTPLVAHIIKTSQFRCHLASRPGGSAAPVLSPVLTMSAADPVDAQPTSVPAENSYDVILIGARPVGYTAVACARAAGLSVAAMNGNWSGVPLLRLHPGQGVSPSSRSPTPARARRAPAGRWTLRGVRARRDG
jgi:hypothetical protein